METLIRSIYLTTIAWTVLFSSFSSQSNTEKSGPDHLFNVSHFPHRAIHPCFHLFTVLAPCRIIFIFQLSYLCSLKYKTPYIGDILF